MKKLTFFLALLSITFISCAQKLSVPKADITFWNVWVQNNLIVGMPPHQVRLPQDMLTHYIFKADSGITYVTPYELSLISIGSGATGPQGIQGEPGYTPVKNVDYFDGVAGAAGNNGSNGTNGSVGPAGPIGPIGFDSTSFVNDHSTTGIRILLTAASASVLGDVVYIASTGKATFCKADAIANCPYAFAICAVPAIAQDASGYWITNGTIRDDTWNWTVGGPVYVSVTGTTGNTLTQTAPNGAHNVVLYVGIALSAHIMHFTGSLIPIELY